MMRFSFSNKDKGKQMKLTRWKALRAMSHAMHDIRPMTLISIMERLNHDSKASRFLERAVFLREKIFWAILVVSLVFGLASINVNYQLGVTMLMMAGLVLALAVSLMIIVALDMAQAWAEQFPEEAEEAFQASKAAHSMLRSNASERINLDNPEERPVGLLQKCYRLPLFYNLNGKLLMPVLVIAIIGHVVHAPAAPLWLSVVFNVTILGSAFIQFKIYLSWLTEHEYKSHHLPPINTWWGMWLATTDLIFQFWIAGQVVLIVKTVLLYL
jgi:hypothetical protein